MLPRVRRAATRANGLGAAAPVFAALGDETRLRLVARLSTGGPASIAGLASGETVSRQAVTKHLEVLAQAGPARRPRRGPEGVWGLEPRRFDDARDRLPPACRPAVRP